jgi:lipopolysaccharide export LptBFGC system permease protein LptF
VLNYEWAPQAEAVKKTELEQITRGGKRDRRESVSGHVFVDRQNDRIWYIRKMRADSPVLEGVHITQRNADGAVVRRWFARRATFDSQNRTWQLDRGRAVDYDKEGNITATDNFPWKFRIVQGWTETPWRIASSQLEAQNLSIPKLRDYLKHNGDFPDNQLAPFRTYLAHRWALPWSCLVVVFIAAPLGIVFSRRGVLAGVASSIFIFFGMIFLTNLFLALGKGGRINPLVAAWFPNAFFGIVGLVLLYFRSTNRELPKLFGRTR